MKSYLIENLLCSHCRGALVYDDSSRQVICPRRHQAAPVQNGAPVFTPPPINMAPSEKVARGPNLGTPWRRANWRFLGEQVAALPADALVLDVGAGRGDFADLLEGHNTLALDVYPYPEVDIVCDLTQVDPFRHESFDAILLTNVLEHIYNTRAMLATLSSLLKPGGVLLVSIPFMVKIHQAPIDYVRYTHYALEFLGQECGLQVEKLEGFYDPISLLGEGIGNLKHTVLPALGGARHYAGRALLLAIQALAAGLQGVLGPGQVQFPEHARSQAPTGYHIVYRKPAHKG